MSETAIVKIDQATKALAEARDLTTILEIRDRAVAMSAYAAAKGASEAANIAKEIQLRAERKAGEFLAGMEKDKGGRPSKTPFIVKGVSAPTLEELGIGYSQAHRWQTVAEVPDEQFEEYVAGTRATGGELTSAALYKMGQRQRQSQERASTNANVADLIACDMKYRTIVLDPPWPVQKILRDERPNQDVFDYQTMTMEEIGRLPIPDLADGEGCHLYLWTTHKYLPDCFGLLQAWGFNYQCLLTWVKPTGMTPFSWMYNTEHVLFARCGNLQLERMGLKLAFDAPTNGHSTKPDVFYDRVIAASPAPRIELFARRSRDGFAAWGNEIETVAA